MARYRKVIENLRVDKVAAEGKCVSKQDGQVIFTQKTAPGDVVDARITRNRKNFIEATPIRFIEKSPMRIEPFCSHFELCGGCKWQHLPYTDQLAFKEQQVIDQLERIGKVNVGSIRPIIGSEKQTKYRNKLEYTFTPNKWLTKEQIESGETIERRGLGFHLPGRFDRVLDIDQCHLQKEPSNDLRLFVKFFAINNDFTFYDVKSKKGLLRNLIVRTTESEDLMVIMQFGEENDKAIQLLMSEIDAMFPEITSLYYVVNTKGNDTFHDLDVIHFSGEKVIKETIDGISFSIGPKSFFQTNTSQATRLYESAIEMAKLDGSQIVYDLYCGTGTIANLVAGKAKKVVGIEYIPEAIEDAKSNALANDIENTTFIAGDLKDVLTPEHFSENGQPEVIITDPPRAGMHSDVVEAINQSGANVIVYISCNPATQARDVQLLTNYSVKEVQPVDMFPHTHHVENICLLERR